MTTLEAQGPVGREVGRLEPVAWRWDAGYGTYICQTQLDPGDGFLSAKSKWEPLYADADVQRLLAERDEWKEKAMGGARAHAEFVLTDHAQAIGAASRIIEQMRNALLVAKDFCGSFTADECPDAVAIPISDALAAAEKMKTPNLEVRGTCAASCASSPAP